MPIFVISDPMYLFREMLVAMIQLTSLASENYKKKREQLEKSISLLRDNFQGKPIVLFGLLKVQLGLQNFNSSTFSSWLT